MSTPIVLPNVVDMKTVKGATAFSKSDLIGMTTIGSDNLFTPSKCNAPKSLVINKLDVPIRDLTPAEFSPEWWFMYLWKEASSFCGQAPAEEVKKVLQFFDRAFVKPPKFMLENKYLIPRGDFTGAGGLFTDDELRGYLAAILKIGFDWTAVGLSDDKEASSKQMETHIHIVDRKVPVTYKLVWRGESWRSYEELRSTGYQTQANDAKRSVTIGATKPWHPFSDKEIKRKLWYRRGQNDNCLYSALSVATDWRASVCFPKIEQTTALSDIQKLVKAGKSLQELYPTHKKHIGKVTYSNGKSEYRMITTSKVALMVIDNYFNTAGRQEDTSMGGVTGKSYPEIAVSSIAGTNILAMVEYVRIHHGVTDDDGFTALTRKLHSKMADRKDMLAAFVDGKAATSYYGIIELAYNDAAKYIPRGYKWTTNGFSEIPAMKMLAEVEVDGQKLWRM